MTVRCEFVDPVTGERCTGDAKLRAPKLEHGLQWSDDGVHLCVRHYHQLWAAVMVGVPERV